MYLGARRVRRRGGVAAVLQQIEQGSQPRGSGADRRPVPAPRASEPVRRHEARSRAGATSCCSGWPTRATSRRREADDAKLKPIVTRGQPNQPPGIAPFFVEEVRKHLEQQYGAKVLYESGLRGDDDARCQAAGDREPLARTRPAGARQAAWLPASRSATSSPSGTRSRVTGRALERGRWRPATSSPPWSSPRPKSGAARLRIGAYQADLARDGISRGRAARRRRPCSSRAI